MEIRMIRKLVFLVAVATFADGCSQYTEHDDWSTFENYVEQAKNGSAINCNALLSSRMTRQSPGLYVADTYDVDILDYLHKSNYKFEQCANKMRTAINQYCNTNNEEALNGTLDNTIGNEPNDKYLYFCSEKYHALLKDVNYQYVLPSGSNQFLELSTLGVMILPSDITQIRYGTELKNRLWFVIIYTQEESHILYYGNKKTWSKARKDISQTKRNKAAT